MTKTKATSTVNKFYNPFDLERWHPKSGDRDDYRTRFQRDRDRIIHGRPFRRLQGKTQVFLTGEYDFYRTRLTHSIEVAQIGRSLCSFLRAKDPLLSGEYFIDTDLVEAAGLAHDIGNPPFGHAGERVLHKLMGEFGGFEGNAQGLRMITETFYPGRQSSHRRGIEPTRAVMDSVLKYKRLYKASQRMPDKEFLYANQADCLEFVHPSAARIRRTVLHGLTSIECQIMNWADEVAYTVNDLKDGVTANFITPDEIARWLKQIDRPDSISTECAESLGKSIAEDRFEPFLSKKVGKLICACSLEECSNFMTKLSNRYRYRLVVSEQARKEHATYKMLSTEKIFRSTSVQQLEFKAEFVLSRLFHAFQDNYLSRQGKDIRHLLPDDWHEALVAERTAPKKMRLICDFIAGMTDDFCYRIHGRLFEPNYGSLADLV